MNLMTNISSAATASYKPAHAGPVPRTVKEVRDIDTEKNKNYNILEKQRRFG